MTLALDFTERNRERIRNRDGFDRIFGLSNAKRILDNETLSVWQSPIYLSLLCFGVAVLLSGVLWGLWHYRDEIGDGSLLTKAVLLLFGGIVGLSLVGVVQRGFVRGRLEIDKIDKRLRLYSHLLQKSPYVLPFEEIRFLRNIKRETREVDTDYDRIRVTTWLVVETVAGELLCMAENTSALREQIDELLPQTWK